MSSNFGFTSFGNLGSIVQQVQQVASQVSSQINQIDTGIQDVASNLEQAFKTSSHSGGHPVNTPTYEPNSNPDQNSSISSSSSRENIRNSTTSEKSKQRKNSLQGATSGEEHNEPNNPSTSSSCTSSHGSRQTRSSEAESDFVHLEKPTSEEGYRESTQSTDPGRPKSSRLDLNSRSGFSNPFGYLMGNGGLCGGRGDPSKTASTSEASPLPNPTQSEPGAQLPNKNSRNNLTEMAEKNSNTLCCDMCNTKFGFLTRKKTCSECKLYFCSSCIRAMAARKVPDSRYNNGGPGLLKVCARCQVILKIPPVKVDLMELRVKDLQRYLLSHKISMKDCVEKKDLVELVIKENGGGSSSTNDPSTREGSRTSSSTHPSNTRSTRNTVPVEREQQNFPRSYVQSTHRQDFFERFIADDETEKSSQEQRENSENAETTKPSTSSWLNDRERNIQDSSLTRDNMQDSTDNDTMACDNEEAQLNNPNRNSEKSYTPVEGFESARPDPVNVESNEDNIIEETPVEPMDVSPLPTSPVKQINQSLNQDQSSENRTGLDVETNGQHENVERQRKTPPQEMSGDQENTTAVNDRNIHPDKQPSEGTESHSSHNEERLEGAVGGLSAEDSNSSKLSPSPKRFAKQDLVYIAEIDNVEELNELSVTQLKKLLAMNRVTFKGVVEKEELLKIVTRLWKQEQKAEAGKDSTRDEELCKICMDHPVDCVMLECGHMCTCTQCGKQMAECPICRQYVIRVVRTFRA